MRAFRASAATLATCCLLFASPAFAEVGPPVPLLPVPAPPPAGAPAPPPPGAPASAEGIRAAPLAPADPAWIGTLGAADNALPRDLWTDAPRPLVAAALPLLRPTTSPGLQDLVRRLLLSDAAAPAGPDTPGQPSLLALRVDRLLVLGRLDAVQLIDLLPQANTSEQIDRASVELRMAASDADGACRLVQQRANRYGNPWWDRAIIACQALNGAYDEATIGLSAIRERKIAADPAFDALIETIGGRRQKLDKLPDPTPLRLALLAAAKLPLPPETLAAAGPAALAAYASSDKAPILPRLAAAEKAEAFGALPPGALTLLYGSVEAKPEERAAAVASGRLPDDPRARAILYGVARANGAGAGRIAALTPLLADARKRGAYVTMARLVAPLIAELEPSPDWRGFAGDAARVLLAAGDFEHALAWVEVSGAPELRVLAALAHPAREDTPAPLAEAVAALRQRDPTSAPHQADLLTALLPALGEPATAVELAPLLRPLHEGMVPPAALWQEQQEASAQNRVGETVLLSLVMAMPGDQLSPEPLVLAQIVAGLKAVGLEADARAIAVEAALAAGI